MHSKKSVLLLFEMDDRLQDMCNVVPRLRRDVISLEDEWNALSEPAFFRNDVALADEFSDAVEDAAERAKIIAEDLRDFDNALARLIKLRGKLAEELGVSVMSHCTGGRSFLRTTEYTM